AFKEGLVGAQNLGVFFEALADSGAKANDALDAVGRQKGVAQDVFGALTDAVDAAGTLNQADDRPGQIKIDDNRPVLQVLTFAEHIGRDKDAQLLARRDLAAALIAFGTETPSEKCGIIRLAGDAFHLG